MANTYITSDLIAPRAVAIFKAINSYINLGNREYENMFQKGTYAPGDTINVRQDNFFVGSRGDAATDEPIVASKVPVTIRPLYSVLIKYTPTDLQRDIISFSDEILAPAVRRLSAMINNDINLAAQTQISNFNGDITAPVNSYSSISRVAAQMKILNMNNYPATFVLDPATMDTLRSSSSLQNSFLPSLNKSITLEASMGRLASFEMMEDTSSTPYISGTHTAAGNVTISPAVSSGSTIVLNGFTAGATVNAGDQFSVAGVYQFDQIKRQSTVIPAQFTVTSGGTAGGGGTISVTVTPEIISTGPRQNVSIAIPNNAVVTLLTNSTTGYMRNIAFTKKGLVLCMPPLERMDSPFSSTANNEGVSMRISKTAQVEDNKNIMRLDAQAAILWVPGQSVVKVSKPVDVVV